MYPCWERLQDGVESPFQLESMEILTCLSSLFLVVQLEYVIPAREYIIDEGKVELFNDLPE